MRCLGVLTALAAVAVLALLLALYYFPQPETPVHGDSDASEATSAPVPSTPSIPSIPSPTHIETFSQWLMRLYNEATTTFENTGSPKNIEEEEPYYEPPPPYVGLVVRRAGATVTVAEAVKAIAAGKPEVVQLGNTLGGQLRIHVFKEEGNVEVSAPGWSETLHFPMTAFSGGPGPKLREGDYQIPEGIYKVEHLNPNSAFYLSFKLNYPNTHDRARAAEEKRTNLGGDIFVHGKNVSIGCVAVGDDIIENLFYWVWKAGVSNVQVVIAPYDMREGRNPEFESAIPHPWYVELCDTIEKALTF